jgi:hypothetical protein
MRRFAKDTLRLFARIPLEEEDVVLLPTMSDIEMLGLVRAFARRRTLLIARWFLVFRRDVFTRRAQGAQLTPRQAALRAALFECISHPHAERVFLCTDTEELAAQYQRLAPKRFLVLPIPHTRPPPMVRGTSGPPLQVLYLGDARFEKGYHHLPALVQDLWSELVAPGRVRFVVQSNYNVPLGEPKAVVARAQLEAYPSDRVQLIKKPLASDEYWRVLAQSDICLLLYDRDQYWARSSGILAESLAAGIPVIAPTGTWMSRQFVGEMYRFQLGLRERMALVQTKRGRELMQRVHARPDVGFAASDDWRVGGGHAWSYSWVGVPPESTHLLLSCRLDRNAAGAALDLHIDQLDGDGERVAFRSQLLEGALENSPCTVLLRLNPAAHELWVGLRNANAEDRLNVDDVRLDFLRDQDPTPLGAVGLVYTHPDEVSGLVREMVKHYGHYRRTAVDFAARFYDRHNADGLVAKLSAAGRARVEPDREAPEGRRAGEAR